MIVFIKSLKILFLIIRYRLFFLIGFIPYLGWFKLFLKKNSKKQAYRFREFLEKSGPTFVKLGQLLSVRSDIVGETFAQSLSFLREDGIKSTSKLINKSIMEAFNNNYAEILGINNNYNLLNEKNLKLIAIGSIAEVYRLDLENNKTLAIKVLKPKIRKLFKEDIIFLRKIFGFAQRSIKEASRTKVLKIVDLLEKISNFELDLKFEAAAISETQENFKGSNILQLPKIYWDFCTQDVLVTQWIDGIKIYDIEKLKKYNIDCSLVFKNLLIIFFLQVTKYGFFHGDIHPGNIIVNKNGSLVMIDFGIMGRISVITRGYIYKVWKAFLNQDYKKAAEIHFKAGWVSETYSMEDMALAVRSIVDPLFLKHKNNLSMGRLMEQLFEITRIFGMEIQRDLLLVQKNMLLLEGIGRVLVPNNNIWSLAKEVINRKEFNLTFEENTIFVQQYFKSEVKNSIQHLTSIITKENLRIKKLDKLKSKSILSSVFSFIIIILLLCIMSLLIWKK